MFARYFQKKQVDLEKLCLLNAWIGKEQARMILACLKQWDVEPEKIDLIASHGQTIFHAPPGTHGYPDLGHATLQIGDGDHIAVHTGIITLSDFRQKHIAAGGEGAPLAGYGDYLLFSDREENRVLLNLGGIANFTYLPRSGKFDQVLCSDIGPANTMMDAYVQKHFPGKNFDENAEIAASGMIDSQLLQALLSDSFFYQSLPKSTGPELFNLAYLQQTQQRVNRLDLPPEDVMATLNRFAAEAISMAFRRYIPHDEPYTIYASGGGIHNPLLMKHLKSLFYTEIHPTLDLGLLPDAKEAVLFAILANECIAGEGMKKGNDQQGMPAVRMGKVSFPG